MHSTIEFSALFRYAGKFILIYVKNIRKYSEPVSLLQTSSRLPLIADCRAAEKCITFRVLENVVSKSQLSGISEGFPKNSGQF